MKETTITTQTVLPPLAPRHQSAAVRTALLLAPFALVGMASAQEGGSLNFDVSSVQTSVMGILAVGVAIAVAFAVYRVGKRASGRI